MNRFGIIALFLGLTGTAPAPATEVCGRITDRSNGEPLPYVNVFLSGTTIGTVSDSAGRFCIGNVQPGHYQLIVQSIAYEMVDEPLRVLTQKSINLSFQLQPRVIDLDSSVVVEAMRYRRWRRIFNQFKKQFFGPNPYAKDCIIQNAQELHFERDLKIDGWVATADSALIFENRHLGYRVRVYMDFFKWGDGSVRPANFQPLHSSFGGSTKNDVYYRYRAYTKFEELEPADTGQADQWRQNRLELYRGSLKQFLRAMADSSLDEHFSLTLFPINFSDSMGHYTLLNPDNQRDVSRKDLSIIILANNRFRLYFDDFLKIVNTHNAWQVSYMQVMGGSIDFDVRGNYYGVQPVVLSGYWSDLRFAGALPSDYRPDGETGERADGGHPRP